MLLKSLLILTIKYFGLMKHFWYIYGSSKLTVITVASAMFILWGCTKGIAKNEEPFERLLKNVAIHSKIFNRDLYYAILLPENYNVSTDSYPTIYLLHGYGDDQTSWWQDGLIQYYSDLQVEETGPVIFVMPQGFNSYYVNRYDGGLPYMDYFTTELVPEIDSLYRTKKDKTQRAVMGYSMGGYGALILPSRNPEIFNISVALSMSFRTDEQYINEPQDIFNTQWGVLFGGYGTSGTQRLTDYFKEYSPFHFFDHNDLSKFSSLRILIDCGDDEETLSETNGLLHNLMRDRNMPHEYRVRNGGHSWDYWNRSLPEALKFISYGFKDMEYPQNPEPVNIGNDISSDQYKLENLTGTNLQLGIFTPTEYKSTSDYYPVIFFIHDYEGSVRSENAGKILSLLNTSMQSGKIPNSLIVEIPLGSDEISSTVLSAIISQINTNYRIVTNKNGRVLLGNDKGGAKACSLIPDFQTTFNSCFLFSSALPADIQAVPEFFYYVDITDKSDNYLGNFNLYLDLREKGNDHEYRVRQGLPSLQSNLNGLYESLGYLSKKLKTGK
jgi:S-formylglutathione hydrolase FrmB